METPLPSNHDQYKAEGLDILSKMRSGVAYTFKVKMRDLELSLRPLTIGEQMQINNDVLETLRNLQKGEQHAANESYMLAKRVLETACTPYGQPGAVGPLTEFVLSHMTTDEVLYLYRQYLQGVETVNPVLEYMKVGEMDKLVEDVKKNNRELTGLSTRELLSLARFLIDSSD